MIQDLRLQNFRSYEDATFEFGSNVNIIVGPNGSGKTNLLEALLVMSRGKSYRVKDTELIKRGSPWLRLESASADGAERVCKIVREPPSKLFEVNDQKVGRLTSRTKLPIVLFEPNHLMLIHGSPEERRNYLDDILDVVYPGFDSYRRNYKRTLQQRNALLKRSKKPSTNELFPWNLRLSELGAAIARARQEFIEQISVDFIELYKQLSASDDLVKIAYEATFSLESYETKFLGSLEKKLHIDIDRGFTTTGPHREDFTTGIHGAIASEVASRGETRTIVLALKILELQTIESRINKTPILLLDDVFSELDGARRRALTTYLQRYQTFLTTTDADVVVKHFTDCTILPLGG